MSRSEHDAHKALQETPKPGRTYKAAPGRNYWPVIKWALIAIILLIIWSILK